MLRCTRTCTCGPNLILYVSLLHVVFEDPESDEMSDIGAHGHDQNVESPHGEESQGVQTCCLPLTSK